MLIPILALALWLFPFGGQGTEAAPSAHKLSATDVQQLITKAEAGDADAQLALAKAYEEGNGVAQSDGQAAAWYRKAADLGNAEARNALGVMYHEGRGVEKSEEEAVGWYRKAARQGNGVAMFNLGTAYYNGDGIAVDDEAAYAWFLLAKGAGSQPAVGAAERQRKASSFQEVQVFEKIGDMYRKGDELAANNTEAAKWYRRAAEQGAETAQIKLANLFIDSRSGMQDLGEGRRWCEAAAKRQYSPGYYCLGVFYDRGWGVPVSLSEAIKRYTEAAKLGHLQSELRLGEMYWKGEGVKPDKVAGYAFVLLASNAGLPEAQSEKLMMEKELSSQDAERGRQKALAWQNQYHTHLLRRRSP